MLKSMGLCVANPTGRKNRPCVRIAYAMGNTEGDIHMVSVPLPKKKLFTREELLAIVARIEKAKTVQYLDYDGKEKDIYVCRPEHGEIIEIVPRNLRDNRFEEGFAEIQSDILSFGLKTGPIKIGKRIEAEIIEDLEYTRDSYEYALSNAYNACLLGRVFSRPEFQLETEDNRRVKYEVRLLTYKYVDFSTLYVRPEKMVGRDMVLSYLTEPINVIDGDDMSQKIYRICYMKRDMDYFITRGDQSL